MSPAKPLLAVQYKRHVAIPFFAPVVSPTAGTGIKAHQDSAMLFHPVNILAS
jgi:hypothetical protein